MIHICIVTMDPDNHDRIATLVPGIEDAGATLHVLCHNRPEAHWLELRHRLDCLNNGRSAFRSFRYEQRFGCAEARALLVEKVRPLHDDTLVFLDDDISASADAWHRWLPALIEPITSGRADIAGVDGRYVYKHDGHFFTRSLDQILMPNILDYVSGGWCAVSGRVFANYIMFDRDYFPNYWEDVDFCLRARLHGFRIVATGDVGLVHHGVPGNAKHAAFTHDVFARKWTMRQIEVLREWE